jgi:hypothetical protein
MRESHQYKHVLKLFPMLEVVPYCIAVHFLRVSLRAFGIAITREVDEVPGMIDDKVVDGLGLAGVDDVLARPL